jgi:hypothetical protein
MKYTPNFNDPRVLARTRHAFGFTRAVMSTEKSTPWSTRVIDKYFGQSNNKLSKYLRGMLLICTNNNYSMDSGKCKEYKINEKGLSVIRNILLGDKGIIHRDSLGDNNNSLSLSYPSVLQVGDRDVVHIFDKHLIKEFCMREYGDQLQSLDFIYEDKSHRLWNPIQNIRKETKNSLLAENGLIYNYDIECCAPTLILMHSQHLGNKEWLEALNDYLCYKDEVRTRVSNEL